MGKSKAIGLETRRQLDLKSRRGMKRCNECTAGFELEDSGRQPQRISYNATECALIIVTTNFQPAITNDLCSKFWNRAMHLPDASLTCSPAIGTSVD